jgi:DNA polymerase III delta prime subunit
MARLVHYIRNKIPVLLEGPTGTSKTRTTLIACDYIKYKKNLDKKNKKNKQSDDSTSDGENEDDDDDDQLLRFNLSAETKIDDLLVKYKGDKNSASGLKIEEGLFYKA